MNEKSPIPIEVINRAAELFDSLGWERIEPNLLGINLFDDFCATLGFLSKEQQYLLLDITKNFYLFPVNRYIEGFIGAFNQIVENFLKSISRIYFVPLLSDEDIGLAKSGPYVFYHMKAYQRAIETNYKGIKCVFINSLEIDNRTGFPRGLPSPKKFNNQDNSLIISLDDFIGTGKTAESAMDYLSNRIGYSKEKVLILAMVGQQEGISYLNYLDIPVFVYEIRLKGISDHYQNPRLGQYLSTMKDIEDMLNVDDDFRFGYMQSEALVKVHSVPNNTFPVYWLDSKLPDGRKFISPFGS